MKTVEPETNIY